MPKWLKPPHGSTYGIGLCARCSRKFWLDDLFDDPNYPGLKVCKDDVDDYDPWRLPPREPDPLILPFNRPDTPLNNTVTLAPGDPGWPPADAITPDGDTYDPGT